MSIEEPKNSPGLWLSLAEIARRKGVSRQAIAERVARFEEANLITTQPGRAGAKLVNLAEFDRLTDEQTSFAKLAGARGGQNGTRGRRAAYNDAITEKAQYDAELRRIELEEKCGRLVPVEDLQRATEQCAEVIVATLEGLPRRAEEIEQAARSGSVRPLLKSVIFDMRKRIAEAFTALAKDAADKTSRDTTGPPAVQIELPMPGDAKEE